MIRKIWLVILLVLTIAACQPTTTELTEQQKGELVAEVDAAWGEWWNSWQALDFEQGMSFISPAPEASWAGDEKILYGIAAMREDWSIWAAGLREQDVTITDSRTIVLSPDIAYTIRQYAGFQTRTDGTLTPEITGIETLVWIKKEGKWKILSGHESTLKDSWKAWLPLEAD